MCYNINNQDLGEELHPCRAEFLLIRRGWRLGGSISERKLAANRANAQLSTGPRTTRGKARSSRNALKHGLLSSQILLEHEDANELEALREGFYADLQPVGTLEEVLVERIIASAWLHRRALRAETALMEWEHGLAMRWEPELWENNKKWRHDQRAHRAVFEMVADHRLEKIQRYETTKERQMYKALHELQRLQAARQNALALAPVAVDVDVQGDGASAA